MINDDFIGINVSKIIGMVERRKILSTLLHCRHSTMSVTSFPKVVTEINTASKYNLSNESNDRFRSRTTSCIIITK